MGNNTKTFYNTKIPSDWEIVELGKLVDEKRPVSYGIVQTGELVEDGIPCIRVTDIIDGEIDTSNLITTSKKISDSYKRTLLKNGDLVMALRGKIGQIAKIKDKLVGANLTRGVALIALKDRYSNDFILHQISSDRTIRIFERSLNGSALQELSIGVVRKIPITLPKSLPEQRAIARVLSTWDQAIHLTEQLIAQKERRKKWLMQKLLTGKIRLKGFGGEWKKEKLEKYLEKHDEKTTTNNQYPVLTSSRKGIFFQSDYYNRDVASEDNTGYNVVPRGYFTYRHMSDDLIFKFNLNDIVDKGIVSTLYPVFKTKGINDYFLLTKLNDGNEFKMHAGEQKQGGSRTYVYFNTLCQLKLNLPSIEEQTAIARVLQAADKEISLLKAKVEKMREQKKGLMQVLLTGKKRLKVNQ